MDPGFQANRNKVFKLVKRTKCPIVQYIVASCILILSSASLAQLLPPHEVQAISHEILANRTQNAELLKAYSWKQRTEVIQSGEVKTTKLELVRFNSEGKEQRTVLAHEKPEQKKRIAGVIQKRKIEKLKEWGEGVKALLIKYTLQDTASLQNFLSKVSIRSATVPGQLALTSLGLVQTGDSMTVTVDQARYELVRAEVFTHYENEAAIVEVTYGILPSGLSYVREMTLEISAKSIRVRVENFDYNQNP